MIEQRKMSRNVKKKKKKKERKKLRAKFLQQMPSFKTKNYL